MANKQFFLITVALLGGAVLLTTACGSSNSNPAPGSSTGGTGAAAGSSAGGTAGSSTGGTSTGGTSAGGTGGTGGAGCTGSDFPSCYSCAPKSNDQYLNACKGGCQPFDNSTLSRFKSGHLPPLP